MANKHMKRCSTSLVIKEMQIKTTVSNHLTPSRMVTITKKRKKSKNNRVWVMYSEKYLPNFNERSEVRLNLISLSKLTNHLNY